MHSRERPVIKDEGIKARGGRRSKGENDDASFYFLHDFSRPGGKSVCSNLQALRALSQSRLRRYVGSILFPLANTIPVWRRIMLRKPRHNTTTFERFARDKDVNCNNNRPKSSKNTDNILESVTKGLSTYVKISLTHCIEFFINRICLPHIFAPVSLAKNKDILQETCGTTYGRYRLTYNKMLLMRHIHVMILYAIFYGICAKQVSVSYFNA